MSQQYTCGDAELDKLIEAVATATFHCGEWQDDTDGPYDDLLERARAARKALYSRLRERLAIGEGASDASR